MADNRQFADHVEIGGANVYFKEEPTTDTTMANTSYFKTVDADGNPVKISRDNIMGIVKECLGTILNGLSDQTTVTKVPTLNGNTLGASTAATLASVLGVQKVNFGSSQSAFETAALGARLGCLLFGFFDPAITYLIIGFKYSQDYASFISFSYSDSTLRKLCQLDAGTWTWF